MFLQNHFQRHHRFLTDLTQNKDGGDSKTLTLNVLLLGAKQSGRSSVGNALIGCDGFRTGHCISGLSVTTRTRLIPRTFPRYFRRNGAESHLALRVIDTPPGQPRPQEVRALCPEGVHVIVMVVRADRIEENSTLERDAEALFGPDWSNHSLLVITHTDRLKEAGFLTSSFLMQTADWLRALRGKVVGGVSFVDSGDDWPSPSEKILRDRILSLSARNHHQTLECVET